MLLQHQRIFSIASQGLLSLVLVISAPCIPLQARWVSAENRPSKENSAAAAQNLKDGLYLILREGTAQKALVPIRARERVGLDDYKYLEGKSEAPPEYLVVRSAPDVPLILEEKPRAEKDVNGQTKLYLTLSGKYVDRLERLTRDNMGSRVAVLVGAQAAVRARGREARWEGV